MAKRSAKPSPAAKAEEEFRTSLATRRKEISERFYSRMAGCLEVALSRWEEKVKGDPNYQPTPSDIAGMMKVLRESEEAIASHGVLDEYLSRARKELQNLENSMLGMLQSDPDD